MSVGLVLEGGGMRCLFTAGVLDVLMEENIPIDTAIGVSAGAVFGCNIKSEQDGRVIRYNLRFAKDPRYFGLGNLIKTGDLFGAEFCYETIPYELDLFDTEAYLNNPMDFYSVATDLKTGKADYHLNDLGNKRDLSYLQASASMPLLARPVKVDEKELLDGGIADPIPVGFAEELGLDKIIVVRPHPEDYKKKREAGLPLAKLYYKDHPEFYEALERHHQVYNESVDHIEELKDLGKAIVIAPEEKIRAGVAERDHKKILEAYNLGRKAAYKHLDEIREFIMKD